MAIRLIGFKLNEEKDPDLCAWLDAQPNKSGAIREAMRAAMEGGTRDDAILAAIHRVERKLAQGVVVGGNGSSAPDDVDDADVQEPLGNLAKMAR